MRHATPANSMTFMIASEHVDEFVNHVAKTWLTHPPEPAKPALTAWGARIAKALEGDTSDDKDFTGQTPRLDAMLRCLESEYARYTHFSAVRETHRPLIARVRRTRQQRQDEAAELRRYRDTAKEARERGDTSSLPEGWPKLIDAVSADDVFIRLGVVRKGKRWICPLCHYSKGRKGSVDTKGPLWHCYHCKSGGSHLTLLETMGRSRQDSVNEILSMV